MRTKSIRANLASAILLLSSLIPARAEEPTAEPAKPDHDQSWAQLGGRAISGNDDSAKYNEYRDFRPGAFGNFHLDEVSDSGKHYWEVWGDKIGYNDENYGMEMGEYGGFRFNLNGGNVPHLFSLTARTLHVENTKGYLELPDATQQRLQTVAAAGINGQLQFEYSNAFPTRLGFDTSVGNFSASQEDGPWTYNVGYQARERDGTRPFGFATSTPGGTFVEVAAPVDDRTIELTAGAQYSGERGTLRLDYLSSVYRNDLDALIVDNPFSLVDNSLAAPKGSGQFRSGLWPDNEAHNVSLNGAINLDSEHLSRITGTLSIGERLQNQPFLPHTINTRFAGDPQLDLSLTQLSLEGEVDTLLANVQWVREIDDVTQLTAKVRYQELTSKTPTLVFPGNVENDAVLRDADIDQRRSAVFGFDKTNASLNLRRDVTDDATINVGWDYEGWQRTPTREVQDQDEHGVKASVDYRLDPDTQLRTSYRHAERHIGEYDTFARPEAALIEEALEDVLLTGQSVLLRKYDEAERTQDKVEANFRKTLTDRVSYSISGGLVDNDYDSSPLGLTRDRRWNVGGDLEWIAHERVLVTSFVTHEDIQYDQHQRFRPVVGGIAVDREVNDFFSTSKDLVDVVGVDVEAVLVPRSWDANFSYFVQDAKGETRGTSVPGVAGAAPAADSSVAPNFPDLKDSLEVMRVALNHHASDDLTLRLEWRAENYNQENFKVDDLDVVETTSNINEVGVIAAPRNDVFLGARLGDYSIDALMLSAIYKF